MSKGIPFLFSNIILKIIQLFTQLINRKKTVLNQVLVTFIVHNVIICI